jgi:hypothetical protein
MRTLQMLLQHLKLHSCDETLRNTNTLRYLRHLMGNSKIRRKI